MDCNMVKDLIPLYIDGCCSAESKKAVEEHMEECDSCRKLYEDMNTPSDIISVTDAPMIMGRLNEWKASVLQSVLLFLSFALIAVGVAFESRTPPGIMNGFWAVNFVIPTTGFMLSLANWYFVRLYRSRKIFSYGSLIATLGITLCAYIWSIFHYDMWSVNIFEAWTALLHFYGIGILLTAFSCFFSKILSDKYAKMLGKE